MAKWNAPDGTSLDLDAVVSTQPMTKKRYHDPATGARLDNTNNTVNGTEVWLSDGRVLQFWGADSDGFNAAYDAAGAAGVVTEGDTVTDTQEGTDQDRSASEEELKENK